MANVTILNPATNQHETAAASTGNAAQAALAIGPYTQRALILVTGQGEFKVRRGRRPECRNYSVIEGEQRHCCKR